MSWSPLNMLNQSINQDIPQKEYNSHSLKKMKKQLLILRFGKQRKEKSRIYTVFLVQVLPLSINN